jgi:hypothetical protein
MNSIKLLILFFVLSTILNSCGTFSEAGKVLRNEKVRTTDEFLVKKRDPLVQPPNFEEIPEPGSLSRKTGTGQNKIEEMMRKGQPEPSNNQITTSSTEESLLKQIKK